MQNLPIYPEQASTIARDFDLFLFVLLGLSMFFLGLIVLLVVFFSIRYRAGSRANRELSSPDNYKLEIFWTVVPTLLVLLLFGWSTKIYFNYFRVPENAQEIFVTGKQWMWKIQHPNGRREINELHVPVNTPIKLTMTSEDVIHSLFVPEFRVKKDVLPGTYSTLWFEATKTGVFNLFCAEYCGTEHALMKGNVYVMELPEYQRWLEEGNTGDVAMASSGEHLFNRMGCAVCHREGSGARGPVLTGLFGSEVQLTGGETTVADEAYIRESIMNPKAHIVAGYTPLMPTFEGQLSQDDVTQLISYIKSLDDAGSAS